MMQALAFLVNPAFWKGVGTLTSTGSTVYGAVKGTGDGGLSIPSIVASEPKGDSKGGFLSVVDKTISAVTKNVPFLQSILGDKSKKKAANYQRDIGVNTGHAYNWFNEHYGEYSDLLSSEEWDYLRENLIPNVQSNPYYGGLGSNYRLRYGRAAGRVDATVPSVGLYQDVERYIEQKLKYEKEMEEKNKQEAAAQNSLLESLSLGGLIRPFRFPQTLAQTAPQETSRQGEHQTFYENARPRMIPVIEQETNNYIPYVVFIGIIALIILLLKRR